MLFLWLIDSLTPPPVVPSLQGPPGRLAGLFATDDGLSNLLHQARRMPCCQVCSMLTVVYRSHSPALGGHISSQTGDCLIAEVESSGVGFSVTVPKWALSVYRGKV